MGVGARSRRGGGGGGGTQDVDLWPVHLLAGCRRCCLRSGMAARPRPDPAAQSSPPPQLRGPALLLGPRYPPSTVGVRKGPRLERTAAGRGARVGGGDAGMGPDEQKDEDGHREGSGLDAPGHGPPPPHAPPVRMRRPAAANGRKSSLSVGGAGVGDARTPHSKRKRVVDPPPNGFVASTAPSPKGYTCYGNTGVNTVCAPPVPVCNTHTPLDHTSRCMGLCALCTEVECPHCHHQGRGPRGLRLPHAPSRPPALPIRKWDGGRLPRVGAAARTLWPAGTPTCLS